MKVDYVKKFLTKLLKEELDGVPHLDKPELFSIRKSLTIKDDDGIEYTVADVDLSNPSDPLIKCYRFNLDGTREYITLDKNSFKDYSRV